MARLEYLRRHLEPGKVYRRKDLTQWSNAVDRHLGQLIEDGTLQKLSGGLYYYPENTTFGNVPPKEDILVKSFLKDDRFLLTSPNLYNNLGVGTTQLYNTRFVYNRKRAGEFTFGNRKFIFRIKPFFPEKLSDEFLLVDLIDNLHLLAEDHDKVLEKVLAKAVAMDKRKLKYAIEKYGGIKAKNALAKVTYAKTA